MKKEVIELEAMWFGGGFHFRLAEDESGFIREIRDGFGELEPYKIEDGKIVYFWKKVEELGVWSWKKKYPYWKQKFAARTDGCAWTLKLRDRQGRAKYCSGYESFPRKFKKLIQELNTLFDSEIDF